MFREEEEGRREERGIEGKKAGEAGIVAQLYWIIREPTDEADWLADRRQTH